MAFSDKPNVECGECQISQIIAAVAKYFPVCDYFETWCECCSETISLVPPVLMSCDRIGETNRNTTKLPNSLDGCRLRIVVFFSFLLLFTWMQLVVPKWNMSVSYRIGFFLPFLVFRLFKWTIHSSYPVCPVHLIPPSVLHLSKPILECPKTPASHKNSPEDGFKFQ